MNTFLEAFLSHCFLGMRYLELISKILYFYSNIQILLYSVKVLTRLRVYK